MSIRLTHVTLDNNTGERTDPIGYETTFDGQTFFWGPGDRKAFADDGQGIGHANNSGSGSPAAGVVEDNELSGRRFPSYASRA